MDPKPDKLDQSMRDISIAHSKNVTLNQTTIIQIAVEEIKTLSLNTSSPYKSLKKFEPEDKDRFFGRDQFLTGLVDQLETSNFLLLLGASGSGKSSVVRAGLIPWLRQQHGNHFSNFILTPDQDPFEALYASLLQKFSQREAKIARSIDASSLSCVVQTLKSPQDYWLIFIDQFEELFNRTSKDKRGLFLKGLLNLLSEVSKASGQPVKVVATMRADFLAYLSSYPGLVKASDGYRPILAEMQVDEIRLAIEQPAAHHGVVFEPGLVQEIIKDVQGQAGYLPLLQYTLNLLWQEELQHQQLSDRTLHKTTYFQLEGVRGALQKHLDKVYQEELSASEQTIAKKIFLQLVEIGEHQEAGIGWIPTRRRAARAEFEGSEQQKVLDHLIDRSLLVSNLSANIETIEISHESLLTSWSKLNTWIRENRQAISLRNRLNDDLLQWKKTKADDDLWSGYKLEQILELRQELAFNDVLGGLSKEANQFVDISARRQRNRNLLRTGVAAAMAGIASVSFFQWRENRFQEDFSAVLVGGSTNPKSLYVLDRALKIAKREANQGDIESASKTYQNIQTAVQRYRSTIDTTPQLFQEADIERIDTAWTVAEAGLLDIVQLSILPKLEAQLAAEQYGELIEGSNFTYEQRYTEGALQTTYQILSRTPGFGADVNDSGFLESADEAERMPCEILEVVEDLWRKYTRESCGFYGEENYFLDADCPLGRTVTLLTFRDPLDAAINQIESCPILKREK